MTVKICSKCRETKPLSEFYGDARYSDGHYPSCKACKRTTNAEGAGRWYAANAEYHKRRVVARRARTTVKLPPDLARWVESQGGETWLLAQIERMRAHPS